MITSSFILLVSLDYVFFLCFINISVPQVRGFVSKSAYIGYGSHRCLETSVKLYVAQRYTQLFVVIFAYVRVWPFYVTLLCKFMDLFSVCVMCVFLCFLCVCTLVPKCMHVFACVCVSVSVCQHLSHSLSLPRFVCVCVCVCVYACICVYTCVCACT